MPLPALIDPGYFAGHVGLEEAELEPHAAQLIEAASGAVRDALEQRVDRVEEDVVELEGNGTPNLVLPELPVASVATVTVGGEELEEGTAWRLRRGRDGRLAIIRALSGRRWARLEPVQVTYTHGYALADVPDGLRLVVARIAARAYFNPTELRQEATGRASGTSAAPFVAVTDVDRLALSRYFPG